jgi:hypothetical protein
VAIEPELPALVLTAVARPQPSEVPHVEVKFALRGKRIASEKASAYRIRLKVDSWQDGLRLLLILDDYPPYVLEKPERPVTLGDLVPADRELSPGTHQLFVAAISADGTSIHAPSPGSLAPFAAVDFWVGDAKASPPAQPPGPRLVQLAPRGTFNGEEQADSVLVDFRLLGVPPDSPAKVQVDVRQLPPSSNSPGTLRVGRGQLVRLEAPASGDYEVTLRLLDEVDTAVNSPALVSSRVITVNRDAPMPSEP